MATGLLTLASLLVAAGASPGDVWPVKHRVLKVPIQTNPAHRHEIKELQLYVSADEGKTWSQVGVADADKEAFVYHAPVDGLYWFGLVIIYLNGNREPADVTKAPPALKVRVDTLAPVLHLSAERQGESVDVRWTIQEEHPDLASLKLEYHPADSLPNQWFAAPAELALTGHTSFRCDAAATLRLQFKDQAGNAEVKTAEVPGRAAPITAAAATAPVPPPGNGVTAPAPATNVWDVPPTPAPTFRSAPRSGFGAPATSAPPPLAFREPPSPAPRGPAPEPQGSGPRVLASSDGYAAPGPAFRDTPGRSSAAPTRDVETKIIRNREVTLNYEVKNEGPAGISKVELWLTDDDGRSWQTWPARVENASPAAGFGLKQRSLTADLRGEGTYGLCLVVYNKAGLSKGKPQPGDPPELRVEVDLTKPEAKLYDPEPDPRNPNVILLRWSASDRNPAPNPVTIQWRAPDRSIWQPVAADLPLTGQHPWHLTRDMPSHVYLRLLARDAAGNEQVLETKTPALIDVSRPEGHILGVSLTRE
jgi:hypothetical protein